MIGTSVKLTALTVATLLSASAFAFDETRQGFFISLGAGLHGVSMEDNPGNGTASSDSSSGFASSFKLGGGISNQFSLYYIRNASWFKTKSDSSNTHTYLAGISGLGGTYYLKPTAPSAYVMAAVGASDYAAPFATNIDVDTGSALALGAGYEFSKHMMVEATVLSLDIDRSTFDTVDSSVSSFQVTFNYMWY